MEEVVLDLDQIRAVRVLGRGAMGTVFLARAAPGRSTSLLPPLFALKVVDKRSASAKPQALRRARWELSLLARLSSDGGGGHPFLPCLLGSVDMPDLLAWALPFCPGRDLHALCRSLSPDGDAFSLAAIRFYLSEIVVALAHLHSLRIAYRDLKPENVLLQSSGHITLTDFDLSRHLPNSPSPSASSSASGPLPPNPPAHHPRRHHHRHPTRIFGFGFGSANTPAEADHNHRHCLKKARSARVSPVSRRRTSFSSSAAAGGEGERSFSFVGTEEYVSPEVVRGEGHGLAVDWWALGVLAYEMAYGRTPFKGRSRKETFRNVLSRSPEFAGGRRCHLTDLIERLLAKDPARRLGSVGGAEELRTHPFFRGVQWDLIAELTRPPFLPPPVEDLEEAVAMGIGSDEGFDVRDYFKGLLHAAPPTSPLASSGSLTEF